MAVADPSVAARAEAVVIAPLRRAHRWIWSALVLALPGLVIAAWAVRPPADAVPVAAMPDDARGHALSFEPAVARGFLADDGSLTVTLEDEVPLAMAYLSATHSTGTKLPSDAIWLGAVDALAAARLRVPDPQAGGTIVLYSLGTHAVFARAASPVDRKRGG